MSSHMTTLEDNTLFLEYGKVGGRWEESTKLWPWVEGQSVQQQSLTAVMQHFKSEKQLLKKPISKAAMS